MGEKTKQRIHFEKHVSTYMKLYIVQFERITFNLEIQMFQFYATGDGRNVEKHSFFFLSKFLLHFN